MEGAVMGMMFDELMEKACEARRESRDRGNALLERMAWARLYTFYRDAIASLVYGGGDGTGN